MTMTAREALEKAAEICRKPREYLGGASSTRLKAWAECEAAILALRDSLPQESAQNDTPATEPTEPEEIQIVLERYENAIKVLAERGDEDDEDEMNTARAELMGVLQRALAAATASCAQSETPARAAALERLYLAVMVHDRGMGRETFILNQEQASEALHTIARFDAPPSPSGVEEGKKP